MNLILRFHLRLVTGHQHFFAMGCEVKAYKFVAGGILAIRLVYLLHQSGGFGEDGDDVAVVVNILPAQCPPPAVFEPFLRGLIATDVHIPSRFRHMLEVLRGVDVYILAIVGDLLHQEVAGLIELHRRLRQVVHEMQFAELVAIVAEMLKLIGILRVRDTREIDLEELLKFCVICGRI